MSSIGQAARAVLASASPVSRSSAQLERRQPKSTANPPALFDRFVDIDLPQLFSTWAPDHGQRAIRRALLPNERSALQQRAEGLRAGLAPYLDSERDDVEAAVAAMLGGFRSMRQDGDSAEGMMVVTAGVLKHFPLWAIEKACLMISRGETGLDRRFAPNDTEICSVIEGVLFSYRKSLSVAEALLAAPVEQPRDFPKADQKAIEAMLGRPIGVPKQVVTRESDAVRPPDGKHAERVAHELAERRARNSAGQVG